MSDHTPGPWPVESRRFHEWPKTILGADGTLLGEWGPAYEADIRLIAAAPELLEALDAARECLEWAYERVDPHKHVAVDIHNDVLPAARAAIAKARGES